jgi:phenolphthiocerol/phthiocerol/phthiodiolone dimycocerosyl transferase
VVAHRNFGGTSVRPVPLGCLSPIDLRSRVTPRVGDTETTNFVGLHLASVEVPPHGKPALVGREIKDQLEAALAHRVLPTVDLPGFFAARGDARFEERLSVVLVSNIGVLDSMPRCPDIRITDWQRILTSPSASGMIPGYGVYTYDDRLTIWRFYSSAFYAEHEVAQLGKELMAQLEGI